MLGIAAVERDTGIGKDTLRVWERRYGFPRPDRDGTGDRVYPPDQVERLRQIKRLLDAGHRPARVVGLAPDALDALLEDNRTRPTAASADPLVSGVAPYIDLLKQHQGDLLLRALSLDVLRQGLARFVTDIVAPMNRAVGEAWMRGELQVHEEHLYTEIVQGVLRGAMSPAARSDPDPARPRVLLATVPHEPHTLGLLMAEAMLTLEGCVCVQLGAQVPLADIAAAMRAHRAEVLVLSFSALLPPAQVLDALAELRERLAASSEIWVGGSAPALSRAPRGVQVVREFAELSQRAEAWRRDAR